MQNDAWKNETCRTCGYFLSAGIEDHLERGYCRKYEQTGSTMMMIFFDYLFTVHGKGRQGDLLTPFSTDTDAACPDHQGRAI